MNPRAVLSAVLALCASRTIAPSARRAGKVTALKNAKDIGTAPAFQRQLTKTERRRKAKRGF